MPPTKFLIWELTSAKREDSETESGGDCEADTPEAEPPATGWAAWETAAAEGRDGTAAAIIFLTGIARDAPESLEPVPLGRSPWKPSPLPRVPTAATSGASEFPKKKQH